MGDTDDGSNKSYDSDTSTWDIGGDDTQIFDSQFFDSPISSPGKKLKEDDADQLHDLQSTMPFEDTAIFEDTAVFEDELATQMMDPDGETQLVNLCGETQVMNFDTEIEEMDLPDSVENHATQLFNDFDTEEVLDSDNEGTERTEVVDDTDDMSDEDSGRKECSSSADLENANQMHLSKEDKMENKSNLEREKSQQHTSGVGSKTFTSIRAASMRAFGLAALNKASKRPKSPSRSTLTSEPDIEHRRMLFRRSPSTIINEPEITKRHGVSRSTVRKLFAEDELDETKETNEEINPETDEVAGLSYIASQEPGDASQANALDFVDNFLKVNLGCDDESNINKSTLGKVKPVLTSKGTQSLAKSATLINTIGEGGIYDWDDNREDEGGGEFFRKKKEAFFASESRRPKSSSLGNKKLGLVCSDSKLVLGNRKANDKTVKNKRTQVKEAKLQKNLIDEFNIQETTEDRFDTQMAAEAMEDLCFGLQKTTNDSTKADSQKGSRNGKGNEKTNIIKTRKVASLSKKNVACNESENLNKLPPNGKKQGKKTLKRREADSIDAPVDQIPVKKQCIQTITPIARRTRQSIKYIKPEKIDILGGSHPKGKRSCQKSSSPRLTRSKAAIFGQQEKEVIEQIPSACTTPINRATPVKELSPICMGDEYQKQSFRKSRVRASLIQELCSLSPIGAEIISPSKDSRKRKDVTLIRVLFSRHLDPDIVKQQKKILSRLGASESTSMTEATHFIADDFVRTRNMLEAIALGKPVVTHLWLESCGQACCHIDEKNFLLRDAKKEKEFGFSLPTTLLRARQNPLLKGLRVLITPNTKPGKEILSSLVKAVHGVAVERIGRNALKDDKVPDGLLILSCEEDYTICSPFLEKGAAIYSSELLLNGIVTQRLEYERHRLFLDHVKRTRSTIWLKKDNNQFKPVGKVK